MLASLIPASLELEDDIDHILAEVAGIGLVRRPTEPSRPPRVGAELAAPAAVPSVVVATLFTPDVAHCALTCTRRRPSGERRTRPRRDQSTSRRTRPP